MKPILISFPLCPFVQRARIVLVEKCIDYDIKYIDLNNPPDWFETISPLKKVPVLIMGEHIIFESGVISELLDEIYPNNMHPNDAFRRAMNRSWIEFGNLLTQDAYWMSIAKSKDEYHKCLNQLQSVLGQLEAIIDQTPFFNGETFSLIDATYAPVFMRLAILKSLDVEIMPVNIFPKITQWINSLAHYDAVIHSVEKTFTNDYLLSLNDQQSYLMRRFTTAHPNISNASA